MNIKDHVILHSNSMDLLLLFPTETRDESDKNREKPILISNSVF